MDYIDKVGKRIIVLGCSGSGKSTFAIKLQKKTSLPLIHLDNIWWHADKTHITSEEFDSRLSELVRGEKWIIDGNYSRTIEIRYAACDTVIFLDLSEEDCMRGIRERLGKKRPDIPFTDDTLDDELVEFIQNFRTNSRPKFFEMREKYPDKQVFIFDTHKSADAWLDKL